MVCVAVFIIGVVLQRKDLDSPESPAALYMVLIAVTLAVAAIPEGIPLCVTISLSIGCSDMVKQHVLVRKLAAVETLGSASVICSDKTGTLTEGKMTMVSMWSGDVTYDVGGKGFDPTVGKITAPGGEDAALHLGVKTTLLAGLLCCNTTLDKVKDADTGEEKWEPRGNSSEAPIVVAARKIGFSEDVATDYPRELEIPFSSSRKMMLTVCSVSGRHAICDGGMPLPQGTKHFLVCKGAPNFIIDLCEERLRDDGSVAKMTDEARRDILKVVDEYSSKALRVLAVAVRTMTELPFDKNDDEISTDERFAKLRQNLRLVGLVASIDPDRDGVKDSVLAARGAGIRVVMITGDYLKTAIAIAKNVSILQPQDDEATAAVDCNTLRPGGHYLEGKEMDRLTSTVRVFARAKPEDKLEIVKSIQRMGQVAAMTGDGVNDAPALNQANIGVAMGIQGTEVAKGASVWSENIRSYIARSFDKPFWVNLCGNSMMQYAIVLAQIALYCAVLIPFLSTDILLLRGLDVEGKGWLIALIGPFGTLVLSELSKVVTGWQMRNYQRWLARREAAHAAQVDAELTAVSPAKGQAGALLEAGAGGSDKIEKVNRPAPVVL